ncbi:UDP-glycosyltransferase UGT4-like isoform X3 [Harmonia axyridis]|uniref:UDP-glycosyltransferase UGT4-like isoform X3 n=1 Tax=Harmonia axyridis TaxID=115357 RepID=UPI001E2778F8|nr:UDP-glycosyltransferase UGT4-like isoform X3 [Harmonia axyridis]
MRLLFFLLSVFCGSELVKCAEILVAIPTPFYSHQATFRPLWRELAKRGHRITLITTDPMEENENITQIDYSYIYEYKKELEKALTGTTNILGMIKGFASTSSTGDKIMTYQMTHPDLLKLYKEKKHFDLLFVELIMPIFVSLSHKFNCPFIGLNTMDAPVGVHASVGNAINPAMYPFADFGFGDKLSFVERVKSVGFVVAYFVVLKPFLGRKVNGLFKEYVGDNVPDVQELERNVSAIFVNANPLFFPSRPITPVTINLGGGLHISEPKPLPKDLQKYLDESKDGCIYVSFGTTVNSAYLSAEQKEVLTSVFKDMAPMRILWKFDEVDIANKPKNVEIRTWVPQQDVLRHPNVKAFITQGGLQSMEEAIDSAVPMLGMPFYGDQNNNVNKMETKKFGLKLLPTEMNKESLKAALKELLENPIYKKNIDKLSAISKDQPMKGLEKAVWWTEYVLRHGTQHLRSPSADIPLYQYYFLDVIAVVSVCAYVFYKLMKSLILTLVLILRKLYNFFIVKRKRD